MEEFTTLWEPLLKSGSMHLFSKYTTVGSRFFVYKTSQNSDRHRKLKYRFTLKVFEL